MVDQSNPFGGGAAGTNKNDPLGAGRNVDIGIRVPKLKELGLVEERSARLGRAVSIKFDPSTQLKEFYEKTAGDPVNTLLSPEKPVPSIASISQWKETKHVDDKEPQPSDEQIAAAKKYQDLLATEQKEQQVLINTEFNQSFAERLTEITGPLAAGDLPEGKITWIKAMHAEQKARLLKLQEKLENQDLATAPDKITALKEIYGLDDTEARKVVTQQADARKESHNKQLKNLQDACNNAIQEQLKITSLREKSAVDSYHATLNPDAVKVSLGITPNPDEIPKRSFKSKDSSWDITVSEDGKVSMESNSFFSDVPSLEAIDDYLLTELKFGSTPLELKATYQTVEQVLEGKGDATPHHETVAAMWRQARLMGFAAGDLKGHNPTAYDIEYVRKGLEKQAAEQAKNPAAGKIISDLRVTHNEQQSLREKIAESHTTLKALDGQPTTAANESAKITKAQELLKKQQELTALDAKILSQYKALEKRYSERTPEENAQLQELRNKYIRGEAKNDQPVGVPGRCLGSGLQTFMAGTRENINKSLSDIIKKHQTTVAGAPKKQWNELSKSLEKEIRTQANMAKEVDAMTTIDLKPAAGLSK